MLFSIVFCLNSLYFLFRYSFESSSSALGRFAGSFCRHILIRFDIYGGVSWGRGWYSDSRMLDLSSATSLPEKGWTKVTIQCMRQPSDQISLLKEYGLSSHISGLVQQGVPIFVLAMPSLLMELTFMSPTLMRYPTMNKLAAFTSRCRMLVRWRPLSPLAISLANPQNYSQVKGRLALRRCIISCKKSPPSANSVTRQRCSPSKKASLYWMILGWVSLASSQISLRQLIFCCWVRQLIFTFFIAYT